MFQKILAVIIALRERYKKYLYKFLVRFDKEREDFELIMGDVIMDVPTRFSGSGVIRVGTGVRFGYYASNFMANGDIKIQSRRKDACVEIGDNTIMSGNCLIVANERVSIGADCLIGDMCQIFDSDFHGVKADERGNVGCMSRVEIGDNVWLGVRVMVLKGVSIGQNSVIAAGSVVTQSIPENVVAGGVPARVIKSI